MITNARYRDRIQTAGWTPFPIRRIHLSRASPLAGRAAESIPTCVSASIAIAPSAERRDYSSFVGRVTFVRPLIMSKAGRARVPILNRYKTIPLARLFHNSDRQVIEILKPVHVHRLNLAREFILGQPIFLIHFPGQFAHVFR